MRIASIEQALLPEEDEAAPAGEDLVVTRVTITEVESPCILSRQLIAALGRPGRDSDLQFFTQGNQCIVMWTQPQLSLERAEAVISEAISPSP